MKPYTVTCGLLTVGGVACLFAGLARIIDNQTFLSTAVITEAEVVRGGCTGENDPWMGPPIIVTFALEDGTKTTFGLDAEFTREKGDRVAIAYQPHNPKDARLYSFAELNFAAACLITLGIVFGGLGVTFLGILYLGTPRSDGQAIPGEFLRDDRVVEAFVREPGIREQVRVDNYEHIEVEDPVTGEIQTYRSYDDVPAALRERMDALRENIMDESSRGDSHAIYTYTDETTGIEHHYHSLGEMPPDVRRFFERFEDEDDRGPFA